MHFYNNPELRHKLYNHVGRLQFINELAHRSTMLELQFQDNTYTTFNNRRSTIRGNSKQKLFVGRVLDLMDYLISIRNEGTLSQLSYNGRVGDTPNTMIRSLVQHYSRFFKDRHSASIQPSGQGKLPRSLSPAEIMSQLYVAEGGFKRRTSRKLKRRKNYGKTRKTKGIYPKGGAIPLIPNNGTFYLPVASYSYGLQPAPTESEYTAQHWRS
jgi:hypothetical protein